MQKYEIRPSESSTSSKPSSDVGSMASARVAANPVRECRPVPEFLRDSYMNRRRDGWRAAGA